MCLRTRASLPLPDPRPPNGRSSGPTNSDQPNGSSVDASKWVSETGGNGWGNDELEYYTNRQQNAYQQDGNLVIKVMAEKFTGADGVTRNYTSARLKTLGKFSQTYGRFEAPSKFRAGKEFGLHSSGMLGDDIEKPGWPGCGEIDIY